ncbi:hypothetical protein SCP_1500380 [Sparassis crispa]|uniref:Uncharacterized protein n=1 Tax=Sparassis crispa TaxID=139825 RepID=A0A401H3L4_9APHY|nr:hypothetical protein SCP_1500380 [Sparassis crispa]GBE89036.1 hypothetical protein SCP_1500380 [Sparassis crispa]
MQAAQEDAVLFASDVALDTLDDHTLFGDDGSIDERRLFEAAYPVVRLPIRSCESESIGHGASSAGNSPSPPHNVGGYETIRPFSTWPLYTGSPTISLPQTSVTHHVHLRSPRSIVPQ